MSKLRVSLFSLSQGKVCLLVNAFPSWCYPPPGVRLSGTGHWENVRLQEAGEEEDQEEERRVNGTQWETDPGESQQQICCKMKLHTTWNVNESSSFNCSNPIFQIISTEEMYNTYGNASTLQHLLVMSCDAFLPPGQFGVCLWDEGCPVPRVDAHERWRLKVSHLPHGWIGIRREESRVLLCRDLLRPRGPASGTYRLQVGDFSSWRSRLCCHYVPLTPVWVLFLMQGPKAREYPAGWSRWATRLRDWRRNIIYYWATWEKKGAIRHQLPLAFSISL